MLLKQSFSPICSIHILAMNSTLPEQRSRSRETSPPEVPTPDTRPIPPGWVRQYDPKLRIFYYVYIVTSPPRLSVTHPLDIDLSFNSMDEAESSTSHLQIDQASLSLSGPTTLPPLMPSSEQLRQAMSRRSMRNLRKLPDPRLDLRNNSSSPSSPSSSSFYRQSRFTMSMSTLDQTPQDRSSFNVTSGPNYSSSFNSIETRRAVGLSSRQPLKRPSKRRLLDSDFDS